LRKKKCSCPEYSKNLLNNVCEYCGHLAVFHAKRLSSETKSIPIAKTRKLWKVDLPQQTSSGASEPPPSTAAKPNEEKRKRDKFIAGFNVPTILLNDQKVTAASMFAKAIRQLNRWSEANILSTSFYDLLSNAMMEWEEECPEHDGAKKSTNSEPIGSCTWTGQHDVVERWLHLTHRLLVLLRCVQSRKHS